MNTIQTEMFQKAKADFDSKMKSAKNWTEFMEQLQKGNMVQTPWCMEKDCEEKVKEDSGKQSKEEIYKEVSGISLISNVDKGEEVIKMTGAAKTLNMPLDQKPIETGELCFKCGKEAKKRVVWGRSY